jgi:hypothetical protein
MQPIPHLPSHGTTTTCSGTQYPTWWTLGSRTTHNTPVATSHPYRIPSHTEIHGVPDSCLLPSVQQVAVQRGLDADEDIERHIGYTDAGRWFCTRCNEKSDKRRNRIRDHVAACLGFEIYPCTGECGNATWCVAFVRWLTNEHTVCQPQPCSQVKCKTRQNLREHQQRQHRQCPEWYV